MFEMKTPLFRWGQEQAEKLVGRRKQWRDAWNEAARKQRAKLRQRAPSKNRPYKPVRFVPALDILPNGDAIETILIV